MNKCLIKKDVLYELYITQGLPMGKIAKSLGVSAGSVYNYIHKYGIPARDQKETFTTRGMKLSPERREQISRSQKGKFVSQETREKISKARRQKGPGHKKISDRGYALIYYPEHPRCRSCGYIPEHILVMEEAMGRPLLEDECVHHVNGDKLDNRIENLMLTTKREHMSYHMKKRWEEKRA